MLITKLGRMVTSFEGLLVFVSHETLIRWSTTTVPTATKLGRGGLS